MEFDCPELELLETAFEGRYQLAGKLATLDLTVLCNHDDYLACGSQLEYIGRLRKRLVSGQ